MKTKLIYTAILLASAGTLAACQTGGGEADGGTPAPVCRAEAAKALTGMDRLADRQAMRMTGARLVRQIAPGQGVTMDYRPERVTIETDPRTGKIVRAACG